VHHPDPLENCRRVAAVRKAVGDGVRLMVDVNQRLDFLGNVRLAQCSVRACTSTPRARSRASRSSVKCSPAVGAATEPSTRA
jgi:hypothetical protein